MEISPLVYRHGRSSLLSWALPGDTTADVCIVGAGYTGLWTAYYLRKADPSIKIIIVEKEFAGFGASGRNGGWCSGGFSWSKEKYLKSANRAAVIAMERAMAAAVDEVCTVAELEGIDADIIRTEHLMVATSPAQLGRLTARYRDALDWEAPQEKVALLAASHAAERIAVRNVHGAMLTRGVARLQPAKLVRGLAATVERLGVSIFEQTEVTNIKKGQVTTRRGTVRSPVIIRATEGFTAGLPGHKRLWLPLNSAQIVTEPLPETLWKQIGWQGRELLGTFRMPIAMRSARGKAGSRWAGGAFPTALGPRPTKAAGPRTKRLRSCARSCTAYCHRQRI